MGSVHDGSVMTADAAEGLAAGLLASQPRRWSHVRMVASRAADLSSRAGLEAVHAAAWFHDIGYADHLVRTGCHHLDGAAYLRDIGQEELACLVAHHSSGPWEAEVRGLAEELATYPAPPTEQHGLFVRS